MGAKIPFHHRRYHHAHRHKGYHLKHKRRSPHYTHPRKHYHLKHKRRKPNYTHKRKKPRSYVHRKGYHLSHKRHGTPGLHRKHHHNRAYHLRHKRHSRTARRTVGTIGFRTAPPRRRTLVHNFHHRTRRNEKFLIHKTVSRQHHHGQFHVQKMRNAIYRNSAHSTGR